VTCSLHEWSATSDHFYRVAHGPNAWQFADWANAGEDGTFGNRWDDPLGVYRVLYASHQRRGTFYETLSRFRPDPFVVAGLAEIDGNDEVWPPGHVPMSWLSKRVMGEAVLTGFFAAVGDSNSLDYLRDAMAASLLRYKLNELDAATIRFGVPRRFTQEISRHVFECTTVDEKRAFDGIFYLSRLGDDLENLAVFEPAEFVEVRSEAIDEHDQDLQHVLRRYGLTFYDE
jgi:hypothetical protein